MAVEVSNLPAIALYEKLGFVTILDERDLISNGKAFDKKRETRLYMKWDVAPIASLDNYSTENLPN